MIEHWRYAVILLTRSGVASSGAARLWGGAWFNSDFGALPFPPLHFPLTPLPLSLLFPSPAPPLSRSGPQIQLGGLGSALSSPAGSEFGAF